MFHDRAPQRARPLDELRIGNDEAASEARCEHLRKTANVNDAPAFITQPAMAASYRLDGEAKDVRLKGDYAYVAYGSKGLKVLDISNLNNICETDAITTYSNLDKLEIFDNDAYLIDSGSVVEILDVSAPSMPYRRGEMAEPGALDTAINGDAAYLACGSTLALYDITNRDFPQKLSQNPLKS